MRRMMLLAATAAVVALVWIGASHFVDGRAGNEAFAETLAQIEKAKTITWKRLFFEHISTKDGKSTWAHMRETQCAYKAPGLYRETRLDDNGKAESVEVIDYIHGRKMTYSPEQRKATLEEIAPIPDGWAPSLGDYRVRLNAPNLQWIGKRKTQAGEVNVFRSAYRDYDNERDRSTDLWVDVKSKQLVAVYLPGADIYDYEHDPARNVVPGKASSYHAMGTALVDIQCDIGLDSSLFRLEPPEGYAVTTKQREQVTEEEMLDSLDLLAEFNDKTFPDQLFPMPFNLLSKINRALKKPWKELTPAERKFIETDRRYPGIYAPIVVFFAHDSNSIVKGTFRYLGKGVRLGDKDRIVCWYKLRGAATYRAVHSDLSVKDVSADELPLKVEP